MVFCKFEVADSFGTGESSSRSFRPFKHFSKHYQEAESLHYLWLFELRSTGRSLLQYNIMGIISNHDNEYKLYTTAHTCPTKKKDIYLNLNLTLAFFVQCL